MVAEPTSAPGGHEMLKETGLGEEEPARRTRRSALALPDRLKSRDLGFWPTRRGPASRPVLPWRRPGSRRRLDSRCRGTAPSEVSGQHLPGGGQVAFVEHLAR